MPALDVWMENTEGILRLNTYETHKNTDLYISWQSFVSNTQKINKRHESPLTQKYHTDDNCENLKTSERKAMFLCLRLPYLGNISLQTEKKSGNF